MQNRKVRGFRLFFRLGGWIFLIPLGIALLMAGVADTEASNARLLDEEAGETVATVISKNSALVPDSSRTSNSQNYYVTYRFEVDGAEITHTQGINEDFYAQIFDGDEIPVRYVRHDPSISEVEYGVAATTSIWMGIVAAIAALVALIFLVWRVELIRSAIRSTRQGADRQARVTAHKRSADVAGKRRYRLAWQDASGAKGRSLPMSEKHVQIYPVDSMITVYADPAGKRVWWESDLGLNLAP